MYGHFMQSASNIDWFNLELSSLLLVVSANGKEGRYGVIIDGCRCHYYFQVVPSLQDALQETEEDVIVDGSLMDIVKHDHWVLLKKRATVQLLNQSAVSHKHHSCVVIHRRIESHLVRNLIVIAAQLLCNSLRQRNSRDFSRKHYSYLLVADRIAGLDEELRDFWIRRSIRVVFPEPVSAEIMTISLF